MRELTPSDKRLAVEFGERIRQRRVELGYTQEKVAMLVGANRRAIGELESGKGTSYLGLALSVANVLGFPQLGDARTVQKSERRLPSGSGT